MVRDEYLPSKICFYFYSGLCVDTRAAVCTHTKQLYTTVMCAYSYTPSASYAATMVTVVERLVMAPRALPRRRLTRRTGCLWNAKAALSCLGS